MKRILARTGSIGGQVLLGVWAFVVLIPLAIAVMSSVKSNKDIYADPLGLDFGRMKWGNFWAALQGPVGGSPLWDYLGNTLIASVCSIALGLSCGILAAYGLARSGGGLIGGVNRLFTILITVPILATLVPIFDLTGTLGIRDSPWGISFVYASFMIPPTALLMRPYFAAVPAELIEAAKIDGAGEARTFLQVVLPMAFPTILGIIVVNIIWVWGELSIAIVLLVSPQSKTLPVGLLAFQGQYVTNLGVQAAGLLLAAAPMVLLYFIFSQRITQGMSAGVLK